MCRGCHNGGALAIAQQTPRAWARVCAQKEAVALTYRKWWFEQRNQSGGYRPETMLEPDGSFRQDLLDRMIQERDHRKVYLAE